MITASGIGMNIFRIGVIQIYPGTLNMVGMNVLKNPMVRWRNGHSNETQIQNLNIEGAGVWVKFFFNSDLHWGHRNIIKYTNRGVETNEEDHDEWLIDIWNSTVSKSDIVYSLGDFAFYKDVRKTLGILDRLNGNIHLIKGNHDHSDNFKKIAQHNRVTTHIYLERKFEEQEVIMFHFPISSWHKQHRGSWHLHGHSHGGYQEGKGKILDVGIDNAYNLYGKHKFFDWEMIKEYMHNREEYIADKHRSNL